MKYAMPISYRKMCNICGTFVSLTVDEVNFHGVTNIPCPNCKNPVKFTGDYGKITEGVKVERWADEQE